MSIISSKLQHNSTLLLLSSHSAMSNSLQPHELYAACQAPWAGGNIKINIFRAVDP